jgi:hypothetical protein
MKIADILPQLTIQPLRRFAAAWDVRVIPSAKRDVFEQAILGEVDRLDSENAVRERLGGFEREVDYSRRVNAEMLLRQLLDEPGYVVADATDLIERAVASDAAFFEYARSGTWARHLDPRTVDIYRAVLEVAWEGGEKGKEVSFEEYQLIKRLQRKLNINRRDHRVMEIQLCENLAPIGPQEAEQGLRDLNSYGFVIQFKHHGHTQVVLPEEIALHLRAIYGLSLQSGAYRNLAAKLPTAVIRQTLEDAQQPAVSKKKEFLIERLIDGDVPPATLLGHLDDEGLNNLFVNNFPDQKRPALRAVKIKHLISHFDRVSKPPGELDSDGPDKNYYGYLVELASRQYDVLHVANIIQRDQSVDRAFERGVRYAFSNVLGHPALESTGIEHADGGVAAKSGRMVLWDCKSAVGPYALTTGRFGQFLNYITKEAPNVVRPFLVFSGSFTNESAAAALALKARCPLGTEIALMTAADLKWLAEKWSKEYSGKVLPLDVLAHSGFLNTEVLELMLKLFGGQA